MVKNVSAVPTAAAAAETAAAAVAAQSNKKRNDKPEFITGKVQGQDTAVKDQTAVSFLYRYMFEISWLYFQNENYIM